MTDKEFIAQLVDDLAKAEVTLGDVRQWGASWKARYEELEITLAEMVTKLDRLSNSPKTSLNPLSATFNAARADAEHAVIAYLLRQASRPDVVEVVRAELSDQVEHIRRGDYLKKEET